MEAETDSILMLAQEDPITLKLIMPGIYLSSFTWILDTTHINFFLLNILTMCDIKRGTNTMSY